MQTIETEYVGKCRDVAGVAAELEKLVKRSDDGELTPEAVVEAARNPKSKLHSHFTWDDTEAARKLRLLEAQCLIRSVRVKVEMEQREKPILARAFVSVTPSVADGQTDGKPVYVPLQTALNFRSYREQMLANAASELRAFRNKYALLKELADVFAAVDRFVGE